MPPQLHEHRRDEVTGRTKLNPAPVIGTIDRSDHGQTNRSVHLPGKHGARYRRIEGAWR
jgi:hypothetical protein